jgi:hypothetical protein
LLEKVERLVGTKLPREVIEVTLEARINRLCIRFKKATSGELGEPIHPQIHLFKDRESNDISAVELLDVDEFLRED